MSIVVQINSKVRTVLNVASDATQEEIEQLAFASAAVSKHLGAQTIKRIVYVPGKLINIIAA